MLWSSEFASRTPRWTLCPSSFQAEALELVVAQVHEARDADAKQYLALQFP